MLHENIKKLMEGFQYDAHPMGVFLSTVGALSTFYPDAKQIFDEAVAPEADPPARSRRCRASPPTPTGTASAGPTSIPTTI